MQTEKHIISNALQQLGKAQLSVEVMKESDWVKLSEYVKIVELEAKLLNDLTILEPLWVCGLVYG